jgi:two-component system LytT family sensor kinase
MLDRVETHGLRLGRLVIYALLTLLIFALAGALSYARFYILRGTDLAWRDLLLEGLGWETCYLGWVPLVPLVSVIERRYPLAASNWRRNLCFLFLGSVFCSYGGYLASRFVVRLVWVASGGSIPKEPIGWLIPLHEFYFEQMLFWVITISASVLRRRREAALYREQVNQLAVAKATLESALRKSELDTLRLRLNPHFLFNSLQNIAMLTSRDGRAASRMLARLGDLMRTALHSDFESQVSLREEMQLTRAYLELEKMRFGERLEIEIHIPDELLTLSVPSLLLQPIVENAIRHGLATVKGSGLVKLQAHLTDDSLVLTVSDNGHVAMNEDDASFPSGVGLGTTRERLRCLYGDKATLHISRRLGVGTQIAINLPLEELPAAAHPQASAIANS